MIQAKDAATITQIWINLENKFGQQVIAYMRNTVEPAIKTAARDGRNSASIESVNPMFIPQLQPALVSLGYSVQFDGSRFLISW